MALFYHYFTSPKLRGFSRQRELLLAGLVVLAALLPRLFQLDRFLTADEPKSWFGRTIQFLSALSQARWSETFDSPAPGVTTMWAGSLGLLLDYARQGFPSGLAQFLAGVPFDPLDPTILPLIRLPVVLVATLTALLTYLWGRQSLGRPAALLAALLIALDPFLLALTRILGHDGLVTLFMWLSLLAFLKAVAVVPNSSRRFILFSGLCGGLAFLTKYPSLFLGAFTALAMLVVYLRGYPGRPAAFRAWLIDMSWWSAAAGLVFILLWPAMWVDPVGRVLAIFNDAFRASGSPHPKGSFFFGQPVPDPGTSYYLIVTLFRTTPILWLGWGLLLFSLIRRWLSPRAEETAPAHSVPWRQTALILFTFALLFGLLVTIGGKKQDRYILPIFPALATLAALGYQQFTNKQLEDIKFSEKPLASKIPPQARKRNPKSKINPLILVLPVILHALFVLPHHPYYFTYYNPFLGGGAAAARTMVVGWGEGLDEAARWLNGQPEAGQIDVVAWYSTTFEPFFKGEAIYEVDDTKISRTAKPGLVADYVILYVNQVQRELPSVGTLQFFQAVPPVYTVTLRGLDYAWIYPSPKISQVIGAETRLVGQAELLGFNLFDPEGQPLTSLQPDQPATVELYWEWQGKSPDEPIGLSLVDEAGYTWGWGTPLGTQARLPFEQWGEGMVAQDNFVLSLFPGIPPGDYYLKSWIDRPATGEVVGVFPLTLEDGRLPVDRPAKPFQVSDLPLSEPFQLSLAEDQIRFLGLSHSGNMEQPWQPGESRELQLYWEAGQDIAEDYPVTLALRDSAGQPHTLWQGRPASGRFPTDRWQQGDIIRDPWSLTLPANVPPGAYELTLSLDDSPAHKLRSLQVGGRPRLFQPPPLDLPLTASFGETIRLLGLQGPVTPLSNLAVALGQPLTLALVWQAGQTIDSDYTITVQLLNQQQQVIAQRDAAPLEGTAPTSSWAAGEIVVDEITLDVPVEVGPGPHQLLVALYQLETGERLRLPNGADHLTIPVQIETVKSKE